MADRLPIVSIAGEKKELPSADTIAQSKINSLVGDLALKAPLAAPDFTGDVTFDTDTLVVDSVNNRVGIGTSSLDDHLHVDASNYRGVTIEASGGAGERATISLRNSVDNNYISYIQDLDGALLFGRANFDYGSHVEKMRLTANGLCFNGDTAAANALDDYEEGTWTPTLPNGGTLTVNSATYTKIGRKVHIKFFLTSLAPAADDIQFVIGALPFVPNSSLSSHGVGNIGYCGDANLSDWCILIPPSSTEVHFYVNSGTLVARTNNNYIAASGANDNITIDATYYV
jgi:hypothetical protein